MRVDVRTSRTRKSHTIVKRPSLIFAGETRGNVYQVHCCHSLQTEWSPKALGCYGVDEDFNLRIKTTTATTPATATTTTTPTTTAATTTATTTTAAAATRAQLR